MAGSYWLGVDLGGTKVLAGVFDDKFKVLAQSKQPTEAEEGPKAVFGQIDKAVSGALKDAGVSLSQIRALGMCVPGQVDPGKKTVRYAPNLNWKNFDLTKHLPSSWKFPAHFENDVKLGTYGEYTHGAAKGARSVLGIFVGTGVGGGIIINGEIYSGFNFCAGEIGHTIVHWRKGTELEAVAGRRSILTRAADQLKGAPKHVRKHWDKKTFEEMKSSHLAEHYFEHKDPLIVQMVDDAAMALGAAVGSAVNFLSPEVIVIGGGVAGALGEPFLDDIWDCAQRYVLPGAAEGIRFLPAALKDDAGIVGAAAYARSKTSAAR